MLLKLGEHMARPAPAARVSARPLIVDTTKRWLRTPSECHQPLPGSGGLEPRVFTRLLTCSHKIVGRPASCCRRRSLPTRLETASAELRAPTRRTTGTLYVRVRRWYAKIQRGNTCEQVYFWIPIRRPDFGHILTQ